MGPPCGDKPSFEVAYPEIARQARKRARRLRIAYDRDFDAAAQTALILAAERWALYDPKEPLAAFLDAIFDELVAGELGLGESMAEARAAMELRAVEARLAPLLALLAGLEEELRIVFELREIDGFTMAEIAAMLAIPPDRAYARLRSATRELGLRARATSEPWTVEAWLGRATEWSWKRTFS